MKDNEDTQHDMMVEGVDQTEKPENIINLISYKNMAEVMMLGLQGVPIACGSCGYPAEFALLVYDPKFPLKSEIFVDWKTMHFVPACEACYARTRESVLHPEKKIRSFSPRELSTEEHKS